jgi:hypothetical protein
MGKEKDKTIKLFDIIIPIIAVLLLIIGIIIILIKKCKHYKKIDNYNTII